MTMVTLKGTHFIEAGLQFRGLVHYHHGRKHGGMQTDIILEKVLRVLYPDQKAAENVCDRLPATRP